VAFSSRARTRAIVDASGRYVNSTLGIGRGRRLLRCGAAVEPMITASADLITRSTARGSFTETKMGGAGGG
jgi:hypothetical protein